MNRMIYGLVALLLILGCRASEDKEQSIIDRVRVYEPEPITLERGKEGEGFILLDIKKGYHVQANPAPLPYLIPTQFEVDDLAGAFQAGYFEYPEGIPYALEGSSDTLLVYEGDVSIRYSLIANSTVQTGEYEVTGTLTYQTCDHRMCFPPVKERVTVKIEVRPSI